AKRLLMHAQQYSEPGPGGDRLSIQLSQETLGLMLNSSRQSINRLLKQFEQAGWVQIHYSQISILNEAALTRVATASPAGRPPRVRVTARPGPTGGGAPTKTPPPAPAPVGAPAPGANGCPPGSHRGGAPTRTSPGPVPCRSTRPGREGGPRDFYPLNAATNSSSQGLASSSGVTVSLAARRSIVDSPLACTSSSSSRSCSPPWQKVSP